MIGFSKNTYLIACNSYLYLFSLYGRTIFYHILGGRGSMYHVLGGVHDALRDIGRVYHRPLCACPADSKQAQANNKCYSCSHVTLDFSGFHYLLLVYRMVRFRVHAHIVPVGRECQDVRRLVVGHVDAEAGVHEQVAVLLLQEIGFRLELAAQTAPAEHRHLVASPSL